MRLLANENLPAQTIAALQQAGHDVVWMRTEAPGSRDEDVLARAQSEERILITFDKDFGELAFRAHLPSATGIVLLRISAPSPEPCPWRSCQPSRAALTGLGISPSSRMTAFA